VLFAEPDVLALDEPTNYLDLEGAAWLEDYLETYPGTVIVVSHDRDMLNRSVTHILALEDGKGAIGGAVVDDDQLVVRHAVGVVVAHVAARDAAGAVDMLALVVRAAVRGDVAHGREQCRRDRCAVEVDQAVDAAHGLRPQGPPERPCRGGPAARA
jgi:ATP-binding cassette subfamily F protein 3